MPIVHCAGQVFPPSLALALEGSEAELLVTSVAVQHKHSEDVMCGCNVPGAICLEVQLELPLNQIQ